MKTTSIICDDQQCIYHFKTGAGISVCTKCAPRVNEDYTYCEDYHQIKRTENKKTEGGGNEDRSCRSR